MATGFLIRITVILDIKDVGLPRWARAEKLLDDSPQRVRGRQGEMHRGLRTGDTEKRVTFSFFKFGGLFLFFVSVCASCLPQGLWNGGTSQRLKPNSSASSARKSP